MSFLLEMTPVSAAEPETPDRCPAGSAPEDETRGPGPEMSQVVFRW